MVTWFVRRSVGGAILFFLASLMTYTTLVYAPGGVYDMADYVTGFPSRDYCIRCGPSEFWIRYKYVPPIVRSSLELYWPWPHNFLAYLLDPTEGYALNEHDEIVPAGVQFTVGPVSILGSGLLTGDLGQSAKVAFAVDVTNLIGPGPGESFAVLVALIVTAMLVATFQRLGRPVVYQPTTQLGSAVAWDRALHAVGYPRVL
jgi:hypothetical protein